MTASVTVKDYSTFALGAVVGGLAVLSSDSTYAPVKSVAYILDCMSRSSCCYTAGACSIILFYVGYCALGAVLRNQDYAARSFSVEQEP